MPDPAPILNETPNPAESKFRRVWQRVANRWKWPGWGLLLLSLIQGIPDWKGRLEFWLQIARTAGGYGGALAIVVGSPYFSGSLSLAGVLWLLFIGEPKKSVLRGRWLPYFGWSVFAACATAIAVSAVYGYTEMRAREIAAQIMAPLKAPSDEKLTLFTSVLKKAAASFDRSHALLVLSNCSEPARRLAVQMAKAIREAGRIVFFQQEFCTPEALFPKPGIIAVLRDPRNPSTEAAALMSAMRMAKIDFLVSDRPDTLRGLTDIAIFISD